LTKLSNKQGYTGHESNRHTRMKHRATSCQNLHALCLQRQLIVSVYLDPEQISINEHMKKNLNLNSIQNKGEKKKVQGADPLQNTKVYHCTI